MGIPAIPAPKGRRRSGAGFVFLVCGVGFSGVGIATRQTTFLAMGPTFLLIGIALVARGRNASR